MFVVYAWVFLVFGTILGVGNALALVIELAMTMSRGFIWLGVFELGNLSGILLAGALVWTGARLRRARRDAIVGLAAFVALWLLTVLAIYLLFPHGRATSRVGLLMFFAAPIVLIAPLGIVLWTRRNALRHQ